MSYTIDELDIKNDSEEEQIRSRTIFENLKAKAIKGEILTEYEKDFFCQGVKLSQLDDGKIEDYDCCSDFKFKILYLTYFHDLSGNGKYEKPKGISLYSPKAGEVQSDITFLKKVAQSWRMTVEKTNHSETMLQKISTETRYELKHIEDKKGWLLFRAEKERYQLNILKTLLQSKYIYHKALKMFERFDNEDFVINLNGQDIEIDEASIVHIMNRHYSQITKANPTKSFHNEDFEPQYLNKQLKEIFHSIDSSGLYKGQQIDRIAFKYRGTNYVIWIKKRTKQIKGKGNIEFHHLETFYPLDDEVELRNVEKDFTFKTINDMLGVYIKK